MFEDGIAKKEMIRSFLMIGQSNMAGRGDYGEVEPIVNPRCYMLRMGRWQKMSEPINPDRSILEGKFHSGVGLAASFADEYTKHTGLEIGLIPCADGGTKIEQWQPGEVLFDHAIMMTRLAIRTSQFGGIIWHQGESNCIDLNEAEYRKLFLNTMTSLRRELDAEELPLIIGEVSEDIAEESGFRDMRKMNALLHQLQKEVPLCGIVSVEGLGLKADGIHFNSKSYRILGKRYFEKYKELAL